MNIFELRAKALEISNKAALVIADADDADKLAEAQRMLDESDALEARAAMLEKTEERTRTYEAAAERLPVENTVVESRGQTDARADAFDGYLRGDVDVRELRAQGISTNEAGGYTVPTGFLPNVVKAMQAYGPMNEGVLPNVITTSTGSTLYVPTFDDTAGIATIIGEATKAPETDVQFGQLALGAHKYTTGEIKVSRELLQDAAVNVISIIEDAMSERLGRALNRHFTIGTGTNQPTGIVTGATMGHTSIAAGAISFDDLVHFMHSLDPAYRANAVWQFSDAFLKAIRLMKDENGNPIWQPGLIAGAPATVLGKAYHINSDMADIVSGGAPALFGDFKKAYTVRKVRDHALARLNELYAVSDQVAFVGFGRYDGGVTDVRAMKKLVIR